MNHTRLTGIMSGEDRSLTGHIARVGLALVAAPYGALVTARNRLFDWRVRRSRKLGGVVISVGNLTTGGTGKTPMVIELARRLLAAGRHPAVLLRGYRSEEGQSDEAAELADALGDQVPVVANPDRAAGAARARELNGDVDVFILDDGFQHRQIYRDLDIVMIDATLPFGFGHILPRGLLRESKAGLARADAIIITRFDPHAPPPFETSAAYLYPVAGKGPLAYTAPAWTGWRDARDTPHDPGEVTITRPYVVCAIGNPGALQAMAARHFDDLAGFEARPDHHAFTRAEVDHVFASAQDAGADAVIVTEKDWVKWRLLIDVNQLPLPVYRPKLAIKFLRGSEALDELLADALNNRGVAP